MNRKPLYAAEGFKEIRKAAALGRRFCLAGTARGRENAMEQATGARRAAVAMSGGVDSSVAALLLAQAGWACTGVTLRLYAGADAAPDGARTCCSLEDVEDARAVARRLGIRHYTFNFTEAFERDVIGRFVQGYLAGETPNPCIDCNKHIKFSALLRRAQLMGCTHVATGHYARIVRGANGRMLLQTGLDAGKDQSYMLYGMTQRELAARIGSTPQYLQKILHGERSGKKYLSSIEEILKISLTS